MEKVEVSLNGRTTTGAADAAGGGALSERLSGPERERLQLEDRARRWWAAYGGDEVSNR